MCKKILISIITIIVAFTGFLTGFFSVGCSYIYAIDVPEYTQVSDSEKFTECFMAYCKSRDTEILGGSANVVTTFTYNALVKSASQLGIDINRLQAELYYKQDQNQGIQWFMTSTGVSAFNELFAQLIADKGLEVGDTNVNENLFNGHYYTYNNYTALCFEGWGSTSFNDLEHISVFGSAFMYDTQQIINLIDSGQTTITIAYDGTGNHTYTGPIKKYTSDAQNYSYLMGVNETGYGNWYNTNFCIYGYRYGSLICRAYPCIYYNNGKYYGRKIIFNNSNQWRYETMGAEELQIVNDKCGPAIINIITINNNPIKNEYEGDTIINNEGDIINNPTPEPTPEPNNPNDVIHNVPSDPLGPDGIDLPDIDIPSLPIGNLSEKFPFSIPWDLVAFYAMLDAEPQAPRFNGTMDLTLVQWNYDIDLAPFDSAAELCRKLQFGLFVVGLIVASRSIIRG